MTHAIGDTVQFETYPAPCIFLGMKRTALVDDNEAQRKYYEAEFGVPGILPSTTTSYNLSSSSSKSNPKRSHSSPPQYFIMGLVPG